LTRLSTMAGAFCAEAGVGPLWEQPGNRHARVKVARKKVLRFPSLALGRGEPTLAIVAVSDKAGRGVMRV
jgi:hypothetical protein